MFFSLSAATRDLSRPTLEDLYTSHAAKVMRWASRLLGSTQDAGDVTQEVFVIVQRRLAGFTARDGAIDTWLFRITENVVRNRRRAAKLRTLFSRDAEPALENTKPPDEAFEARRAARLVAEVLELMSATDRELLVLFELEGHPGEEVAGMLGLSPSVIWVRLHRARARFAEKLKVHSPEDVP